MPDDWIAAKLSEVATVNPRQSSLDDDAPFVPMNAVEPFARWPIETTSREGRSGAKFSSEDVLFARITPCLENGKVAQWPLGAPPAAGSTEFIVIRAGDRIDPGFLYFWATTPRVRAAATSLMVGTTGRQRLSKDDLADLTVLLPPIAEQRRIADLMAALDAQIVASRAEIARAEELARDLINTLIARALIGKLGACWLAVKAGGEFAERGAV